MKKLSTPVISKRYVWQGLRQATGKYFRKQNLVSLPHISIEPTMERSPIVKDSKKNVTVLPRR